MSNTNNKKNNESQNNFAQNYQKAFNNYTNLIKFYSNNTQLMDSIGKIIDSYKENILVFKKKLIQIKANLIKPLYNDEKKNYKYEEEIYSNNNSLIFRLNQFFELQIDLINKFINDIEKNLFSDFEQKRINDFSNSLQQSKNKMQNNQKTMEKYYKEYNSAYQNFYNDFESIESDVQKYYIDRRRKKLEETNIEQLNNLNNEANLIHENFFLFHKKFQENNKKFFDIYNDKIKKLEEEAITNEYYIKSNFNSFQQILIKSIKSFLNFLENNSNKENEIPQIENNINEIDNNTKKEEEQSKDELKNFSKDLNSFESKYLEKIESNYIKDKYKVQANNGRNQFLGDNQTVQDKKIMNSLFNEMNLEEFIDNTSVSLTDEDVFETMKFFYEKYEYVDTCGYDLVLERKKLEVKKLTYKLLQPGLIKKDYDEYKDIKPINDSDLKKLENYINKDQEFRLAFLLNINFYRTFGIFDMPEREFNITGKLFSEITDIVSNGKDVDFQLFKLIIILSQTFYVNKDGTKFYLFNKIKGHKIFSQIDFIKQYLDSSLNEEFQKAKIKSDREITLKEKQGMVFANILSFCKYMAEFGVPKQTLLEINESFYKEYKLSQDLINDINAMLELK